MTARDVLVVDDEPDSRALFQQGLRREVRRGVLRLHFAADGAEALEILRRNEIDGIVVLTDLNMPGINGLQLLEEVRKRWANVAVYLVTAYDSEDYRARAATLGADGYLTKPIDFSEIRELLAP